MKIKVTVSTNRVGSQTEKEIEIDDDELEDYVEEDRQAIIEDMARNAMFEMIEWNWTEITEENK